MPRKITILGRLALLAAAIGSAPPARSAEVAGIALPQAETVQGQPLRLTGCGVREELWMELYAISLYLPQGVPAEAARILDDGTAKLLRMDVTYDGKVPDGLPDDWTQRLRDQVRREFIRILQDEYNDLRHGDTVRISYVPNQGTTLSVNGRTVVTRQGGELIGAMLNLWIGREPVSGNLKRLLLSGSC